MKIKQIIKEEILKHKVYSNYTPIKYGFDLYKNPKSIKRFPPEMRAISTPSLDLYVVDEPENERGLNVVIHSDILQYLRKHEGYSLKETAMYLHPIIDSVIGWTRRDKTNDFYLAESYNWDYQIEPHLDYLYDHINKLKEKFPLINFIPKKIYS
jgi:hypothetical protein